MQRFAERRRTGSVFPVAFCAVALAATSGCHAEFHASAGSGKREGEAAGGEAAPAGQNPIAVAPAAPAGPRIQKASAATPAVAQQQPPAQADPPEPGPRIQKASAATPAVAQQQPPAQADPPEPGPGPAPAANGTVELVCQFSDAWVAVVPRGIYRPTDEYLMQALIGFTTDADFWDGQAAWERYRPYAARQCGVDPLRVDLAPGSHVVLVGWAGRYEATGEYSRNGRIERVVVRAGQTVNKSFTTAMLNHDWSCISCPYLAFHQGGRIVEVGQVLVDRYAAAREGTDVRTVPVEVRDGRITLRLIEREPEVSRVDAIEVRVDGRWLPLAPGAPTVLSAVDGRRLDLSMGQVVDVAFDAGDLADGNVAVEIRVTGYYEPVGPLL